MGDFLLRMAALLVVLAQVPSGFVDGQAAEPIVVARKAERIEWATGTQLDRQTLVSNTGQWVDVPLRSLLEQISRHRKIPIFVDRRVDPSTAVTLSAKNLTWEQLLLEIGRPHGCSHCRVEDIYYFGPVETAMTLPANFQKLNRWIKENRKQSQVNWRRPTKTNWPRLTQPQKRLQELLTPFDVQAQDLDLIPFDLWPANDLNQTPLVLNVALMVVGFDKWVLISKSGKKVKIVAYPKNRAIVDVNSIADVEAAMRELGSETGDKSNELQISRLDKNSLRIVGNAAAVYSAFGRAVAFQVAVKKASVEQTFTAQLEGKRGSIAATMAQQLDIELEFDPELGGRLNEHVEFEVKEATVEQILELALQGTGIRYRIERQKLKLFK